MPSRIAFLMMEGCSRDIDQENQPIEGDDPMKLGWCGPIENAPIIANAGLDFIEVPLAPLGLEERASFAAAKRAVAASPLPTLAFNLFLPSDMRVVGPEVDRDRVKSYLSRAAELLAYAQSKIVVYGSGRARNVPEGFDRAKAEAQFIDSLHWSAEALKGSGTTLVIEPLNRKESNIVNSVREGVRFAKALNRPEIRVLADFYHMDEENEPLSEVATHMEWLSHIHLADTGRFNPGTGSYDYDTFFGYLKTANYRGMLSAECTVKHPEADMRQSLAFLRRHWPD
jgi:sugar phosphate isomerase/epimerase